MMVRRFVFGVSDLLNRMARQGAILCFIGMVVFIAIQVGARYVLNAPPTWTEELARYAMIWGGLLGATVAFKHRVDPVLLTLPAEERRWLEAGMGLARGAAVLIFLVPVLYFSVFGPGANPARGFIARAGQRTADTLGFPMWIVAIAVPVCASIILVHLAARACASHGDAAARRIAADASHADNADPGEASR